MKSTRSVIWPALDPELGGTILEELQGSLRSFRDLISAVALFAFRFAIIAICAVRGSPNKARIPEMYTVPPKPERSPLLSG